MTWIRVGTAIVMFPSLALAADKPCPKAHAPIEFEHKSGLGVARLKITFECEAHDAYLVRASPREAVPIVAVQQDPEHGTRTLLDYLRVVPGAKAAVSGGFMASYYPPLPTGLVKSAGRVTNRRLVSPKIDGVACFGHGDVSIGRADIGETTDLSDCLQSGPLLVVGAQPVGDLETRVSVKGFMAPTRRAFVAVTAGGSVVLGVVEHATLSGLARFLAMPASNGGIEATTALNLSGSVSAGIAVVSDKPFGSSESLLANAIVLVSSSQASLLDKKPSLFDREQILSAVQGNRNAALRLVFSLYDQRVPFKFGGKTPSGGLDTSGFVAYVLNQVGMIERPKQFSVRLLRETFRERVDTISDLRSGDLIFEQNKTCWFVVNSRYTIGMTEKGIVIGEPAKFSSGIFAYARVQYERGPTANTK